MPTSEDMVTAFLSEHPLDSKWLDDIINVLLESPPNGSAHVRKIAGELSKKRKVKNIEEVITRRINDFCYEALDFKKSDEYILFKRIEKGTYQLTGYPDRPNIIELINISFVDPTMQGMWEEFIQGVKKVVSKDPRRKWDTIKNQKKLEAFAKYMEHGSDARAEYEQRKKVHNKFTKPELYDLEIEKK